MHITDKVSLGDIALSDSGYLEAFALTARTGVQQYLGAEVGRPDLKVLNVYRDQAEVFSKDSLRTFSKIPITNDHPGQPVTAANWKQVAVGTTGDEVLRDGEYLKIGLKITDADAVGAVQAGKRELSVGYSCELVWEDGIAPDGTAYQAKQTNIIADHIAIVQRGRAGSRASIGDSWPQHTPTPEEKLMTLKTVTVDGIPVEVTDQGAIVIATLQQRLADSVGKLSAAESAHATVIAAKDAELARKDAEIDDLKGKQITDAQIDERVKARGDLLAKAKAIHDADYAGKGDAEIRKAVIIAKLGDAAIAGKTEAYIDARFDLLVEDAAKNPAGDPFRHHMIQQDGKTVDEAEKARLQMISDMQTAHRPAQA